MSASNRPGWYGDPEDLTQWRYFDGAGWTEHRSPIDQGKPRHVPSAREGGESLPPPMAAPPAQAMTSNEPGWYIDPSNPLIRRYWNGRKWTGYTASLEGPLPEIPANHLTASPGLFDRFKGLPLAQRLAIALAVIVVALGAAAVLSTAEDNSDDARLGRAYCADLRAGAGPGNLAATASEVIDNMTPRTYAEQVYEWLDEHCPDQLRNNNEVRSFLDANGIDPDR